MKLFYIFLLFIGCSSASWAQTGNSTTKTDSKKEKTEDEYSGADKSTPDFLLEQDTIFVSKKKKKKRKKKTFNKLKTKRGYTSKGSGRGRTDELFFYLKKYQAPSKYVSPVYVYDIQKLKLVKLKSYNPKKYPPKQFKIPHGPYKKKKGEMIMEEGYFWAGTFHDNWFRYSGEAQIVASRRNYHKGFPEKYKISYYDPADQTIIKEINPFDEFDRNSGIYKLYRDNGRIELVGKLAKGRKLGKWYEYYPNGRKKIETEYSWNTKEGKEERKVLNEWNTNGKLKEEYVKKKAEKEKSKYKKQKF